MNTPHLWNNQLNAIKIEKLEKKMFQEIKNIITQRKHRIKVGRQSKGILSEDKAKYNEMESKEKNHAISPEGLTYK